MKTVGAIRIPAGYEGTFRQEHAKPHAPTFYGRVLRRKHGIKVPRSWGNVQERPFIRRTMEEGSDALSHDRDWVAPLMECHSDPEEGYLHTVLATGEVLPFSLALAVAYEYPCTLGQQQPDLHERLVYSSIYGIPLIAPAKAQGIHVEHRREQARRVAAYGGRRVGYVSDNRTDYCSHRDEVHNRWRKGETHYECYHDECFVMATARMYFTSEEEYMAHWNSLHAAISPWFICPVNGCHYVATGEPDALDWYLDHVAQQHVTSREGGQLEREGSETTEGTIRWGLNHQYRWPEWRDSFQPCRRPLVNGPEEGQPGISVRWQMRQLIENIHDQQYPRDLQADVPPVTDGKRRNRRSGVKLRARRERAVQKAHNAPSSTATSCSSNSRHTARADQEAMLKHLLRGTRPQQTTLQTHRGAALSYEDTVTTPEAVGEEGSDCWTLERIQTQYR